MKTAVCRERFRRPGWQVLLGLLVLPLPLAAAPLDLSQVPLSQPTSESTRVPIKPNLMFILDDSGSMGQNYTPDYVSTYPGYPNTGWGPGSGGEDERHCLDSLDDSDGNYDLCLPGDPPFMSSDFNTQYYDPTTTYSPGVTADGTPKTSMSAANTLDWTQVPFDAYGRQNTGMLNESAIGNKTNLLSGFYDRVWCDSDSPLSLGDPSHCKRNASYLYPDAFYGFGRRPSGTSPRSYFYVQGAPYYYQIGVGEHCSDAALTNCVAASMPTGAYVYPARVRWCNSAARTTCQGRNTPTFRFVKFSALSTGGIARGTIVVGNSGSDSSATINDIRVGTVSIIGTAVTAGGGTNAASERSALAQAIRSAINAYASLPEYSACDGSQAGCTLPDGSDAPDGTVVVSEAGGTPGAANGLTVNVGSPVTPTSRSYAKLQFTTVNKGSTGAELSSVKVNGVEVLGTTLTASNNNNAGNRRIDMANRVCTAINNYSNGAPWEYDAAATSGASGCPTGSSVVYVRAPFAQGSNPNNLSVTLQFTNGIEYRVNDGGTNVAGAMTGGAFASVPTTTTAMAGGGTASSTFSRVDITPANFPRTAAATRKDCVAVAGQCSYGEEMTNFANWYAYYRTRMQLMKTAAGQSFSSLGSNYRVGFTTINNTTTGGEFLPIKDFESVQKGDWYTTLYSIAPGSGTPLRHALSRVGRLFAGKKPFGPDSGDPMQYACQQNFALLTTDGYWNENWDTGIQKVDDSLIGDSDGVASVPRPYFDGGLGGSCGPGANFGSRTSACGTLADVAYHYYATDLRTSALGNCTGSPVGANTYDVCENKVKGNGEDSNSQQHMTTFTLGLGVDGTLDFREDYKSAASGDYKDIKDGLKNWPQVKNLDPTAVDDLWHAAVNGRGSYLSARSPASLSSGLSNALAGIKVREAAGAAAATSNLEPVAGDNFSYVASYTTNKWTGNLEAREIDTATGQTREQALWCVEDVAAKVDKNTTACNGTLKSLLGADSDTRSIHAFSAATASKLRSFAWTSLSTAEQAYFDPSKLSQYGAWSAAEKTAATGDSLLGFVRGRFGMEDQDGNSVRIYRNRESALGDIVGSQPVYVGKPPFDYSDAGYATFKSAGAGRTKAVYVAANDGMLHAFNADLPAAGGGTELWAYVPAAVMPDLYRLADKNYTSDHRFFVDGSPSVGDACVGSGACVWKTILVGGFNAGGKGYYALDVSDPANPKGLWELTTAVDGDVGYSFGNPIITKRPDGRWVVLVTSGYNNVGSGRGILYVLDAGDGTVLAKLDTGVGSTATPSGLGRITGFALDASTNNTVRYVYGGDLLGNVWRFDLQVGSVALIARLKDAAGNSQPITTRPLVTIVDNVDQRRMILIGTGQLAELNDLSDTQVQTVYGFLDNYDNLGRAIGDCGTCPNGARDELVQQVLSDTGMTDAKGRPTRTVTVNAVDLSSRAGWYVDLPQAGERVNVDMALTATVLTFGSNAPKDDICTTGGDSFLTSLDYRTGSLVPGATYASSMIGNAFIVGLVILRTDGGYVITTTRSDDPTPEVIGSVPGATGSTAFQGRRVTWREVDN